MNTNNVAEDQNTIVFDILPSCKFMDRLCAYTQKREPIIAGVVISGQREKVKQ
jgi:hypothetical protein